MTNSPAASPIVDWLRAGYPDGIPDDDYAALLALLAPRRLTNDEVADIAGQLRPSSRLCPEQTTVADNETSALIT